MTSHEVQNDEAFRQAIETRFTSIETYIRELIPRREPEDAYPGIRDSDPRLDSAQHTFAECNSYFQQHRELASQFGDPSAEHARDMIGNLDNVVHRNLNPINIVEGGGLQDRVDAQLAEQEWIGHSKDAFIKRLRDLILALASQQEVAETLRHTMSLHWSLLCAARTRVLSILDNTISAMQKANQAQDNPVATFLEEAWTGAKKYLGQIDVVGIVSDVFTEGPAKAMQEQAKDLASVLLNLTVEAISEPGREDPMYTLQNMVEQLRDVRKATQTDSEKISHVVAKIRSHKGDGYLEHEVGQIKPDANEDPDSKGGRSVVKVHPVAIDTIANRILGDDVRGTVEVARGRMVEADRDDGGKLFHEQLPQAVDGEFMFDKMRDEWSEARTDLEKAMHATEQGIDSTCQTLRSAASAFRNTETDHTNYLMRLANDGEL